MNDGTTLDETSQDDQSQLPVGTTEWDVKLAKVRNQQVFWGHCGAALKIVSFVFPLYVVKGTVTPFAGETTTLSVKCVMTVSIMLGGAALTAVIALVRKRGQGKELIRLRERLTEKEKEIISLREQLDDTRDSGSTPHYEDGV